MAWPKHRLEGSGRPVIVLLNGAGAKLGYWNRVRPLLAPMAATLSYDRTVPAGFRPGETALGARTVDELRALLSALKLEPPYLLVAHSLGGLYAILHAQLFPREVAGVVLVDSTHPEQERRFGDAGNFAMRATRSIAAWWDRAFGPGSMTEVVHLNAIADEIAAAGPFPDIPLTVITAGVVPPRWQIPADMWDIHLENQRELAALSPRGRQVMAEKSNHFVPKRQPDLIAALVREMLDGAAGRAAGTSHTGPAVAG